MDVSMVSQFFLEIPGCQFIAGLLLGYALRSSFSGYRTKRPGRYAALSSAKKNAPASEATGNEPYFDWADAAVKTFAGRQNNPLVEQGEDS
jgi:hypothetical protein